MRDETEATPYLLDLLHDRNPEVQRVCDATLQMIGDNHTLIMIPYSRGMDFDLSDTKIPLGQICQLKYEK